MTAFSKTDSPIGFGILDENSDGEWQPVQRDKGWTEEQVDYAVMLLNAGVEYEDLDEMVLYTNCVVCEGTFMQGSLDSSKRCVADQS